MYAHWWGLAASTRTPGGVSSYHQTIYSCYLKENKNKSAKLPPTLTFNLYHIAGSNPTSTNLSPFVPTWRGEPPFVSVAYRHKVCPLVSNLFVNHGQLARESSIVLTWGSVTFPRQLWPCKETRQRTFLLLRHYYLMTIQTIKVAGLYRNTMCPFFLKKKRFCNYYTVYF